MIGDRAFEDEDEAGAADVVVKRAEDAAGLDRHPSHAKLSPRHALDLGAEVERCQQFHRDAPGRRCGLFVAHRRLFLV
jgi:hypothetical protein